MGLILFSLGTRYDLPLPLSTFQWAGGGVVGISFIFMTVFAGHRSGLEALKYPSRSVGLLGWLPRAAVPHVIGGSIGVIGLLAVIVIGLLGPSDPNKNLAVYLFWIYFWAGMAVLTGLIGPLWDAINPFRALDTLFRLVRPVPERPVGGGANGGTGAPAAPLALEGPGAAQAAPARPARPARIAAMEPAVIAAPAPVVDRRSRLERSGVWPAVGMFFLFGLCDVTGVSTTRPWAISLLALAYTVFTVAGMRRFGARQWLAHVEFFTVLFSILRRFAPIDIKAGKVTLRPFGAGLLDPLEDGWDYVLFVILMLSTLAFDAILSTSVWAAVVKALRPEWAPFGTIGLHLLMGLGFVVLTAAFLAAFMVCMELVIYFGTVHVDGLTTATTFALTLVPIVFVYNAAHNYVNLVVASQFAFPLLADPLGYGWHLLPTASYQPSLLFAQAAIVWYVQVFLIVVGHVIAMYLAHLRAGQLFHAAQSILLSQYPILVLMVLYTMTSLWILAQPITL